VRLPQLDEHAAPARQAERAPDLLAVPAPIRPHAVETRTQPTTAAVEGAGHPQLPRRAQEASGREATAIAAASWSTSATREGAERT
jgi:hypothetical protein